jgi:ABC-type maltose transport system permease subunit
MVIWRKVIACWVTKAVSICSAYCFSYAQMLARTQQIVTLYIHTYIHCQSCLINIYTFSLHHREHSVISLERTFNLFTVRIEVKFKKNKTAIQ